MPYAQEFNDHDDYYRYSFVLESKTEDIMGEYEFKGFLAPDGMNNIDGTYLQKDGKLYFVCSAYLDVAHQCIVMTEMENPYTLKTDENGKHNSVILSRPEYRWEKKGWSVNEGPAVLYNEDDIFIVYSASGFSSGGYCMGMLTFKGGDIRDVNNWEKSRRKVQGNEPLKNIYNAGHCSFLYRENGDIIMVYHATATRDFFESPRLTYIKPVIFEEGKPVF
jgi:GH43 family beta-xylosidase